MLDEVIEIPSDIRIVVTGMSRGDERNQRSGGEGEAEGQGFHGVEISRLRASVEKDFGEASEELVSPRVSQTAELAHGAQRRTRKRPAISGTLIFACFR